LLSGACCCRCGHCKSLAGPLADAAEELSGEVKVVAVDAQEHGSLGGEYGVKGFPVREGRGRALPRTSSLTAGFAGAR